MTNFVVVINKGPFHGGDAEWPLRFVNMVLDEGHKVQVFLAEDAVWIARKGQQYDGSPNLEEYIKDAVEKGAEIKVCQSCAKRRNLDEKDYLLGLKKGNLQEIVKAASKADKVLAF